MHPGADLSRQNLLLNILSFQVNIGKLVLLYYGMIEKTALTNSFSIKKRNSNLMIVSPDSPQKKQQVNFVYVDHDGGIFELEIL